MKKHIDWKRVGMQLVIVSISAAIIPLFSDISVLLKLRNWWLSFDIAVIGLTIIFSLVRRSRDFFYHNGKGKEK